MMIKLSVYYPKTDGAEFDHDYYRDRHVPLAATTWGVDLSEVEIEKGIDGPNVAAVHFRFPSMEEFSAALAAEGTADVQADVPNYTTIVPVMQISESAPAG
jgi:uncharacterized protein (TIGR02118 family)